MCCLRKFIREKKIKDAKAQNPKINAVQLAEAGDAHALRRRACAEPASCIHLFSLTYLFGLMHLFSLSPYWSLDLVDTHTSLDCLMHMYEQTHAHCTLPLRLPLRLSSLALGLSLTPPPSGSLSRALSSYVCILVSAHVCIFRQAWTPRRSCGGLVGGNTVILDHVPARRHQDSHPVVRLPPFLSFLPFPASQLACAAPSM